MQTEFYNFIENYCNRLLSKNKITENKYFDKVLYDQTIDLIEKYYKLDSSLVMLKEKQKL